MAQNDPIHLMRLFVNIIHLGSFNAAAQKMGITPSKASKDIYRLEETVGSSLLNRTTRSLGMTDAGEVYYHKAIEILESYEGMLDQLNHTKRQLQGELRLTAPDLWGSVVLTPLIFEFREKYPEVSIRANYTNQLIDLFRDNTHIAIRSVELKGEPYLAKKICEDGSTLCASPAYLEQNFIPTTLEELQQLNLITFTKPNNPYEPLEFIHHEKRYQILTTGTLSFNNKRSIYDAVVNHQGAASLPSYLVKNEIAQGHLIELLPEYRLASLYFYALYTQRRKDNALVSTFIEFVQSQLGAA